MERHAIPRQITTFEFKLIGFMSIKQFIYLVVFGGFAVLIYLVVSIPFLNILGASIIGGIGAFFAFFSYNERPLDVWIKNLFLRLSSPSQYYYIKVNDPPYFLQNVFFAQDPHTTQTYIDASRKLASYTQNMGHTTKIDEKKRTIHQLIHETHTQQKGVTNQSKDDTKPQKQEKPDTQTTVETPFLSGFIKNAKGIPLPNIMVYVKSSAGEVLRILKTNHHGIFASYHPLPTAEYTVEVKDLGGSFFFDTMSISIKDINNPPLTIFSKEHI